MQPFFASWRELHHALESLHQQDKALIDELHDIWRQYAPSPDSIIRNPRGYDERLVQLGNHERRLIVPEKLIMWIVAASTKWGYPYSPSQAVAILEGRQQYSATPTIDEHNRRVIISSKWS